MLSLGGVKGCFEANVELWEVLGKVLSREGIFT